VFAVVPAQAQKQQDISASATAITGVYNGTYRCARGPVNLRLTLVSPGDGSLSGVFTFDLPANSSPRTASYTLRGTYDVATGKFRLDPDKWEPPEPANYVMVGMDGAFKSGTEQVSGKITGGYGACTTFEATRNKTQSAALPQHPAVMPAAPTARAAQQPPSSTTGAARQAAPVQARVQPGTIYVCNTSTMNPTIYRSGVFQTAPNTSLASIANAWDAHVRQIYHLGDVYLNSGCSDQFYDQTGQRYIQQLEQTAKTNKSQIVIVDWKYVPGQNTPPPQVPGQNRPTGAQTISASRDQTGQHPATAAVTPQTYGTIIQCLNAKSDVPNPQPEPSCHVAGPDFSVDLKVGNVAYPKGNRSETVTLTCDGQGNRVQCTARVGPRDAQHSM
jgi:hypothetical protein